MKVKINSNTRLNSQHLEKDTICELEKHYAEYLIKLGRASSIKEDIEININENRCDVAISLTVDEIDNWKKEEVKNNQTKRIKKTKGGQ